MNAKTAKSVDLSLVPSLGAEAASFLTSAKKHLSGAAEFAWKGMFDTETRIKIAPGVTQDAKAILREKYQSLGRTMM